MIKLLKPIAHCYGVINAIELAKKVSNENKGKNIYVFGLLVHNEEVTKELEPIKESEEDLIITKQITIDVDTLGCPVLNAEKKTRPK